jgi:hypothetical protein
MFTGHPRRNVSALGIDAFLVVQAAKPPFAWSRIGHRVISRIAEARLTPQAKAGIAALLDNSESLADASTWADEHRP